MASISGMPRWWGGKQLNLNKPHMLWEAGTDVGYDFQVGVKFGVPPALN